MKIYTYKCESCGSKQYVKTKTGYKCKYCGNTQDIIDEGIVEDKKESKKNESLVPQNIKAEKQKGKYTEVKHALIMFLCCYFFGILGVHKFIDKQYRKGFLYLFTMGIVGFGWLVDLIKLAIKLFVELMETGLLDWRR